MKKILVVDALPSSLSRHKSLLARDDVQVLGSTSPDDAVALHRKERADLLIVDLELPGGSAEAFCRRIRSDPELKRVSLIVLCRNSEADLERAARCGANLCLTRPIRRGPLRLAAERLMDVPDRRSYRVLLRVEVGEAPSRRAFFCTSGNLSTAGMLIETDTSLARGDIVTCSFFLPDRARIVVQAEVVRVAARPDGPFQHGLQFLRLAPAARAALKAFVDAKPGRG